ncbi:MAG: hypothetical protein ACYS5V_15500 [Planctomycetota bacterium]|jgi:hypothetical protein
MSGVFVGPEGDGVLVGPGDGGGVFVGSDDTAVLVGSDDSAVLVGPPSLEVLQMGRHIQTVSPSYGDIDPIATSAMAVTGHKWWIILQRRLSSAVNATHAFAVYDNLGSPTRWYYILFHNAISLQLASSGSLWTTGLTETLDTWHMWQVLDEDKGGAGRWYAKKDGAARLVYGFDHTRHAHTANWPIWASVGNARRGTLGTATSSQRDTDRLLFGQAKPQNLPTDAQMTAVYDAWNADRTNIQALLDEWATHMGTGQIDYALNPTGSAGEVLVDNVPVGDPIWSNWTFPPADGL